MRLLIRFFALPLREQATAVEAVFCLALARGLLFVPFRRLAPLLGRPQTGDDGASIVLDARQRASALAIRRALLRVCERLPWYSSCLVRALAGRMMLRRRGMPSALHLGARSETEVELAAHAWLRCGEVDVIGVETADNYTPIVAFKA